MSLLGWKEKWSDSSINMHMRKSECPLSGRCWEGGDGKDVADSDEGRPNQLKSQPVSVMKKRNSWNFAGKIEAGT